MSGILGGADMASSYFLPRLIGSGRANEFLLTGSWMKAQEAMNLGFASRVVPKEEMMDIATEFANIMVSKNPMGVRMTKEAININIDAVVTICLGLPAFIKKSIGLKKMPPPIPTMPEIKPKIPPIIIEIILGIFL